MDLLVLYFSLAIGISFLCSILESVLLSTSMAYVAIMQREHPKTGKLMRSHKQDINKSIASILILNTIANTLGATAVGAQAEIVFDSSAVFYVSVALTFGILFFSEIIPKTIGAIYWKSLAPFAAYMIRFFIWITYPIILLTLFVTDKITKGSQNMQSITKEELIENALLGEDEGVLDAQESDIIENILLLDDTKVSEILTPRSVMFALDENTPIKDVIENKKLFWFSRIPIYSESIDNITGIVLTKKLFKQALKDDTVPLKAKAKPIFAINENIPVSKALNLFIRRKEHMFLVRDSYDQTEGIVTLEDCMEKILGVEIIDESDSVTNMRAFAKHQMKLKRKLNEANNSQNTQ
ncbi:MAG: HlyC/CorC family transporter [Campylobacterales bacterium]|nr:HlyC/CorC family transporter [Campylobacterales bacterium]